MASIKLKGREIPLLYTMMEMKQIQEEVARIGEFLNVLFGKSAKDGEDSADLYGGPEQLNAISKCIRILGNAGLEDSGQEPDLTDKWVLRALKPARLVEAMNACLQAINEGMESEIPPAKQDEPVDVTLEEMNKKKEAES